MGYFLRLEEITIHNRCCGASEQLSDSLTDRTISCRMPQGNRKCLLSLRQHQAVCEWVKLTKYFCCVTFPGRANHWSAIIGSSHSKNYVLWEYGGFASEGVKQVAELGSPVKMEEEIRQKVRSSSLWKITDLHGFSRFWKVFTKSTSSFMHIVSLPFFCLGNW